MTLRLSNAVGGRITKGVAEGRIRDYGARRGQDARVAGTLLTLRYPGGSRPGLDAAGAGLRGVGQLVVRVCS